MSTQPWDAPPEFQKMYRDEYPYDRYLFGYGARNQDIRPEDIPVIRDLYAAEVTFSDHCIGRLLDQVEQMGLFPPRDVSRTRRDLEKEDQHVAGKCGIGKRHC